MIRRNTPPEAPTTGEIQFSLQDDKLIGLTFKNVPMGATEADRASRYHLQDFAKAMLKTINAYNEEIE